MPFSRPPLSALKSQVASDIAANLPGADALLRFSNMGILGQVLAILAHGHYGYLDWISKQAIPFTATDEALEAWAGLKDVVREPAVAAVGTVTFTGTPTKDIPAGTLVVRGDSLNYTTNADVVVGGGGTALVTVTASVASAASTLIAGSTMTLGAAISGVQSAGVVTTPITAGADAETDDSLRSRMLQVYASPPQGGDYSDYIEWALQVPGVTRAWCNPNGLGSGTVRVYIMLDVSESAFGGIPQGTNGTATAETRDSHAVGDQLTVANYIFPLQPVTALVYVTAPIASPQNFTISGLSGASTATKAAISAAIADVFVRNGGPGGALDILGNLQGTTDLSLINTAIANVAGTTPFVITVPTVNIVVATSNIPTVGVVTYV